MRIVGTRGTAAVAIAIAIALASTRAEAQVPPKLWTQFDTQAQHVDVAGVACGLGATATLDGRVYALLLDALEDASELCTRTPSNGVLSLRGRVKMSRAQPANVIVELDVPAGASPRAVEDLRAVLQNMSADLSRRAAAAQPLVRPLVTWTAPPPAPMHPEKRMNVPLIAAGFGMFGGGYLVQLLVGSAIAGSSGDPGTSRAWPFVPIFGLAVFSGTYKEATNCDCETGRAFSMIGSVLVGALQVAGIIVGVVGLGTPKTKMVLDQVSIRLGPNGIEGTF
jgi:hypothetical protein